MNSVFLNSQMAEKLRLSEAERREHLRQWAANSATVRAAQRLRGVNPRAFDEIERALERQRLENVWNDTRAYVMARNMRWQS